MAECFEKGIETLSSMKGGKCLDQLRDYQLVKYSDP
jgi:hypothetical protein